MATAGLIWVATDTLAASRFNVDNSSVPTKSHVSESMQADLMDHFDTIRVLTGTLGYPMFEKITKLEKTELLTCKGKGAKATGEYTEEGLIVFAGSTFCSHFTPAFFGDP